jgi:hypothetical protein
MTAKIAFLSVATIQWVPQVKRLRPEDDERNVSPAMHLLDHRVLTLIFEFAAQSKMRRVFVSIETAYLQTTRANFT